MLLGGHRRESLFYLVWHDYAHRVSHLAAYTSSIAACGYILCRLLTVAQGSNYLTRSSLHSHAYARIRTHTQAQAQAQAQAHAHAQTSAATLV